jgi:putative hydrolase of the HAD superfamily
MTVKAIICDFDGVLSDYDKQARLRAMSAICGLEPDEINRRVWDSGFEDDADSGKYGTGDNGDDGARYLKAFNDHLGSRLTREQWIETRTAGMAHRPRVHELLIRLAPHYQLALLTNNGPLARHEFARLAPETAKFFEGAAYFSCQFGIKKPDPAIFGRLAGRLNVSPSQCLFIDDQERHCSGAQSAGMTALHYAGLDELRQALQGQDILPVAP